MDVLGNSVYSDKLKLSLFFFLSFFIFYSVVEIIFPFIFCETKQNKNIFHFYFQLESIIGLLVVEIFAYKSFKTICWVYYEFEV